MTNVEQDLREEIRRLREDQEELRKQVHPSSGDGHGKAEQPDGKTDDRKPPEPEPDPNEPGFLRSHPVGVIVGLMVLAGLAIGGFFLLRYLNSYESTDDAQIDGHMNMIGTRIAGTVTSVNVQENQSVTAGQVLAEIDPSDYQVALQRVEANLAQSQAQLRAANPSVGITQTTSETTVSNSQADILEAQAGIAGAERDYQGDLAKLRDAEANSAKAQADLERYKLLVAKDEVSREEYDQKVAAAQSAAAQVESAREAGGASQQVINQRKAMLLQAQSRLQQARQNAPRQVAIQQATVQSQRAGEQASKAAVNEARLNLQYTKLIAPVSGLVGRKALEVGMRVQPGQQLLAIVPLNDIWVTANFKETQLKRIRSGLRATMHVDALGRDFEGSVESLPAATGARFSLLPAENATGNYVKVVQRLPVRLRFKPGQDSDHLLRPGMSVEPKIWLQ
ncbi:MAG: HlyD family secretion protein [Acidobacteriota bacterium]|nr:HlyD family secretion protein [Acidobacteriota bacterium]